MTDDLRYPIGTFRVTGPLSAGARADRLAEFAAAPAALRSTVTGLTEAQLDTPYRIDGWTVRQVVHHVADSHANAYFRFRMALTADQPPIVPYDEQKWAELADARTAPIAPSLALLDAMHDRLTRLLGAQQEDAFSRTVLHPERGPMTVDGLLELYAWHGRHHTAHILGLKKRQGWRV